MNVGESNCNKKIENTIISRREMGVISRKFFRWEKYGKNFGISMSQKTYTKFSVVKYFLNRTRHIDARFGVGEHF